MNLYFLVDAPKRILPALLGVSFIHGLIHIKWYGVVSLDDGCVLLRNALRISVSSLVSNPFPLQKIKLVLIVLRNHEACDIDCIVCESRKRSHFDSNNLHTKLRLQQESCGLLLM